MIFEAVLFGIWTVGGAGWIYMAIRDDRAELAGLGACYLAIGALILR